MPALWAGDRKVSIDHGKTSEKVPILQGHSETPHQRGSGIDFQRERFLRDRLPERKIQKARARREVAEKRIICLAVCYCVTLKFLRGERLLLFQSQVSVFALYWVPWYFYLVLIFAFSSLEKPEEILGIELKDFLVHPAEYFLLLFLTYRAFQKSSHSLLRDRFFLSGALFSLLYAASDEWHQTFVPGRMGSLGDLALDALGVLLGAVLYRYFSAKKSDGSIPA